MSFQFKLNTSQLSQAEVDLGLVREFLAEHGEALANAAGLLGGNPAVGRVVTLLEALSASRRLTRAQYRQLQALHDLLSLQHVGDPDRIESALFAEFDPWSPEVEEICLLTDVLDNLLRKVREPEVPLRVELSSRKRASRE